MEPVEDSKPRRQRTSQTFRTARNIVVNLLATGTEIVLGLVLTRFLIFRLGAELYGVFPLSQQVVRYFQAIPVVLNTSARRYLTIDVARKDFENARKTFTTTFTSIFFVVGFLFFPAGLIFSYFAPQILETPEGQDWPTRIIFAVTVTTFCLVNLGTFFLATAFTRNRLDIRYWLRIMRNVLRTFIMMALIGLAGWQLGGISTGVIAGGVAFFFMSIFTWKKLFPNLKLSRKFFDKERLKETTSMSGWLVFNSVGRILMRNVDLLMANLILGTTATGRYGSILIIITGLHSLGVVLTGLFSPLVYEKYGKDDFQGIHKMLKSAIRLQGAIMAYPLGFIVGVSPYLMKIWLGDDFVSLAPTLSLLIVPQIVILASSLMVPILTSHNKITIPAFATFSMGIVNVILSYILLQPETGLGLLGLPISMGIVALIRNLGFLPVYCSHLMKQSWYSYLLPLFRSVIGFIFAYLITYGILYFYTPSGWFDLVLVGVLTGIGYLIIAPFTLLTGSDRRVLIRLATSLKNRRG